MVTEVDLHAEPSLQELPAETWAAIAAAALPADDDDVRTWVRLSLVNKTWRAAVAGVPVTARFAAKLTSKQLSALKTTPVPLRSLSFCNHDDASKCLLQEEGWLLASRETLEELHHVHVPCDPRMVDMELSLAHFRALRALTLHVVDSLAGADLSRLPVSLQHLTIVSEIFFGDPSREEPSGLQRLREETSGTLSVSAEGRTEGLASTAIPLLELCAKTVFFRYVKVDPADHRNASAPTEAADVPAGFRALWLRSGRIALGSPGYTGGDDACVTGVHVAEELCCFLASMPESYREFRLSGGAAAPVFTIQAEWLPSRDGVVRYSTGSYDSLEVLAATMRRFASPNGLAVSVSDDQSHLLVVRVAGQA